MAISGPKLDEFLEWAVVTGVEGPRLAEYRRVATELLEQVGGGRVTESHILHLLDQVADGPGGTEASSLIEEVGESILRFQASRPIAPAVAPAPRAASPPLHPRPEAELLRPPAVPRHTPPDQRVVSFSPSTQTPRPTPRRQAPERRSGLQFRCPTCQVMVTATEEKLCPRCGRRAPSVTMTAASASSGRSWLLPAGVATLVVVGALAFGPRLLASWRDRSQPVAGTYVSPHLGLRLSFPEGWRHAVEDDHAPSSSLHGLEEVIPDAISLRGSRFRQGENELHLIVGARPSRVTDEAFATFAQSAALAPQSIVPGLRELAGLPELRLAGCEAGDAVPRGGLRCAGESGRGRVWVYIWASRALSVVAFYSSPDPPEDAQADADELIAELE